MVFMETCVWVAQAECILYKCAVFSPGRWDCSGVSFDTKIMVWWVWMWISGLKLCTFTSSFATIVVSHSDRHTFCTITWWTGDFYLRPTFSCNMKREGHNVFYSMRGICMAENVMLLSDQVLCLRSDYKKIPLHKKKHYPPGTHHATHL